MPYTYIRLIPEFIFMNVYHFFLRFYFIFCVALLSGCSATGLSGAFGTPAPSESFATLPDTVTPEQARFVSGNSNPDPRVLADMKALASQKGNDVYLIGPSDLLTIKVFQAEELSGEVRVDQRGAITLPLLGNVRIAGFTQAQAERRLADLLGASLLQNPQISIFIKEFTNRRITVEGAVNKQGVFPVIGKITVLQAIALAGGLTKDARKESVALFRKDASGNRVYYLDVNFIRNGEINDPFVMNDDRIVVQRVESQRVTVEGQVKQPGVFSLEEPTTILQVVSLSKGLTSLGDPNKVVLFRREDGVENAYGVNLTAIRQGKVQDPFVRGGDRIVVHRSNSRYWLNEITPLLLPLTYLRNLSGL